MDLYVSFRLTEEEYAKIAKKAESAGVKNVNTFVKATILGDNASDKALCPLHLSAHSPEDLHAAWLKARDDTTLLEMNDITDRKAFIGENPINNDYHDKKFATDLDEG